MTDTSPSHKFRSKTSELTGFLRGMGQHTQRADQTEAGNLPLPDSTTRIRKTSFISFLGRTRKKSLGGDSVPPVPTVSLLERDTPSADTSSVIVDNPPVSTASTSDGHTLGSKIASRFSPSRSKSSRSSSRKTKPEGAGYTSDTLLQLPDARRSSTESRASTQTMTPQPTITVSPSPHFLDDSFDDLFTRPKSRTLPSSPSRSRSPTPQDSLFQVFVANSQNRAAGSSSSSSPHLRNSRNTRNEPGVPRPSRTGPDDPARTSGEESEAISTLSMPILKKRRSWEYQRRRFSSGTVRSPPHGSPPSIPLPSTPSSAPAESATTTFRNLTLSSRASVSPTPRSPPPPPQKSRKSNERRSNESAKAEKENEAFDVHTATADQLRQALVARNQQLDDLASYLLKVTQNHVTEKNALEKRVASLEREAARRDKEIKGLTWLVSNSRSSPAVAVGGNPVGSRSLTSVTTDAMTFSSLANATPYRHLHSDPEDSAGETSLNISGGESSSSVRAKQIKTASQYSVMRGSSVRSGIRSPVVDGVPLSDVHMTGRLGKRSSVSSFASSIASSSSSGAMPSSPTASTALSSIPEATPPPTPPTPPVSIPTPLPSSRDPAIAAAISTQRREKEKEHKKTVPRSTTGKSSTTKPKAGPSAPTPAAAYAANLQKSRPRSIGQILDLSSNNVP